MLEQGYNVDENALDRKMRNMKNSYRTIKDNNKKAALEEAACIGSMALAVVRFSFWQWHRIHICWIRCYEHDKVMFEECNIDYMRENSMRRETI